MLSRVGLRPARLRTAAIPALRLFSSGVLGRAYATHHAGERAQSSRQPAHGKRPVRTRPGPRSDRGAPVASASNGAAALSCSSSHDHPSPSSTGWKARIGSASTLSVVLGLLSRGLHAQAAGLYEELAAASNTHHPRHLVFDMCNGSVLDAQDAAIHWMRAFTTIGRMDKVREVFTHALRDLRATDDQQEGRLAVSHSPTAYGAYVRYDGDGEEQQSASGRRTNIQLDNTLLVAATPALPDAVHTICQKTNVAYPSQLRHSLFNAYLEALTRRRRFDAEEITLILKSMDDAGLEPNALTYHYLVELHIRAGLNPEGVWNELYHEARLQPLPATVQALLLRVVPYTAHSTFVLEVTREALRCGSNVMDKKLIAESVERWMNGSRPSTNSHVAGAVDTTANAAAAAAAAPPATSSSSSSGPAFPPDCVMWLLHELELRCIQDKASFVQYIQKQHLAVLLLSCAKSADLETAEKVTALMDRHGMPQTADVLALMVWCASQAGAVEKALDIIEVMARKGYLELSDPLRRFYIECVRYTMDKHFLVLLAEALSSVPLLERALAHLLERRQQGLLTSVHALDVVVLAAARLGEERRAMHLVGTYVSHWHVQPRTNTFNCLLVGNNAHRGTMLHGMIYEAMRKAGVSPNAQTFRVLIRQAVLSDSIDEAVAYLLEVTKQPGLRVEVEMVLPILERAARAGDVETVNRVSQFALDCDVGIDGAVMGNVMKYLTDAGQNVAVLQGHLPLHEALRSRSKAGRQRVRHTLIL